MKNLPLKIFALFVATLVWVYVGLSKPYQYEIKIPLNLVNIPVELAFDSPPPTNITLQVLGTGFELLNFSASDAKLDISLFQARLGDTTLNVSATDFRLAEAIAPLRTKMVLTPRIIKLKMDSKVNKTVSIQSNLKIITAADHLETRKPLLSFNEVKLIGGRNWVTQFDQVQTENLTLKNLKKDTSFNIALD